MSDFDRQALSQLAETADRYHANLSAHALEYLAERGITADVISHFKFGVCDDVFKGRLAIPYLRPSGVLWINYRALHGEKPKYQAFGPKHIYNTADLEIADQRGEVCIAEGELDTAVASYLYQVPTVGIPGATQWTGNHHWRELFRGYQRVWVLADPDEAGIGLAKAIMEDLPQARLVDLPGDVNESYLKEFDLVGALK